MRYQNLRSFQKQVESAGSGACRCCLIALSDDQERGKIFQSLLSSSSSLAIPISSVTRFQAAESNLSDLFDSLQNGFLFGGEPIAFFDGCEKLGKKEVEVLVQFIEEKCGEEKLLGRLFLGARGKASALMKAVERVGIVLDLTDEKPWDREKRLQEGIAACAARSGKRLAPDAAALLIERIGLDAAVLDSEMEKLICFIGERPTIERADIFRISAQSRSQSLWQTAEAAIWEEGRPLDPAAFHGLLPALRSQLHLGATLCHLMEAQIPADRWSSYLPKIWPRTLEKRSAQAAKKGSAFYKKALDLLFKIELLSRTGSDQYESLLALFSLALRQHASR